MKHSNPKAEKQPVLLQVLPSMHSGGVERGTIDVTKAAIAAGFKVVVASAGGYMSHQVISAGGVHVNVPLVARNPLAIIRNIGKLKNIMKEYQVDIVHARSRGPAWSAYFAAKKLNIPFVTTFHGVYSFNFPFKKSYNKIMMKGKRVIAISDFIRNHILEHYHMDASKITVIPRGVDIEQFDPKKVTERRLVQMIDRLRLPEDKYIVLLPGRITRWKGQNILLDALQHLNKKDIFCVILGDDEKHPAFREELRRRILSEGLAPYVAMVGNVNDMPAAYRLANVVVSTSVRPEAFGRVPAEAGAMEKIVIAPKHGGAVEIIEDEQTGWLVAPEDGKALAKAIEHAIGLSQKERVSMGEKARERVLEKFTVDKMCESTIALYREVLAGIEPEVIEVPESVATAAEVAVSDSETTSSDEVQHVSQEASLTETEQEQPTLKEDKEKPKRGRPKKEENQTELFADEKQASSLDEKQVKKSPAKKKAAPKKATAKKTTSKKPVAKKTTAKASKKDAAPKKRGRPKKK